MSEPERERMTLLTLPNSLSLSRVALIPAIVWATLHGAGPAAIGLFCLAVLTDVLDGLVARRRHQVSRLGTLLDHASDAVFVTALSAVWAWLGLLPPLLPVLIAFAFIQYALDSRVTEGASLRRSHIGRCNGIAYFVVAGLGMVVHHYAKDAVFVSTLRILGWLLVATTLVSMAERAIHHLRAFRPP
jgi:phosphatidylglycerophosphate synthase